MSERFFRAAALAGRLHLRDIRDWESWDPTALKYHSEDEVRWLTRVGNGLHRIARNIEDLVQAVRDSKNGRVSVTIYVHEELLGEAKARWEDMQRDLYQSPLAARVSNSAAALPASR